MPIAFRVYFIVIGVVRPLSNILLIYTDSLDVVYTSYGLVGFTLLVYQVILYPLLIVAAVSGRLGVYLVHVVVAVLASEVALLLVAVFSPSLLVTGGYALFTVMNIMILALSIVAYILSSRGYSEYTMT